MLLVALVGAAVVALVLWRAMNVQDPADDPPSRRLERATRSRTTGPDDDPDFLRELGERVRRRDDPPV